MNPAQAHARHETSRVHLAPPEDRYAAASTIRQRLAALSSLYKHLVRHGHAARNPVGEVEWPAINRVEGSTLAFAKTKARKSMSKHCSVSIISLCSDT
jgi:site-specific recombinase XerD